jgi:hypothetical protein
MARLKMSSNISIPQMPILVRRGYLCQLLRFAPQSGMKNATGSELTAIETAPQSNDGPSQ